QRAGQRGGGTVRRRPHFIRRGVVDGAPGEGHGRRRRGAVSRREQRRRRGSARRLTDRHRGAGAVVRRVRIGRRGADGGGAADGGPGQRCVDGDGDGGGGTVRQR